MPLTDGQAATIGTIVLWIVTLYLWFYASKVPRLLKVMITIAAVAATVAAYMTMIMDLAVR